MEKNKKTPETVTIKSSKDMIALAERIDKGNPSPQDLKALSIELDKYPAFAHSVGNLQGNVFSAILKELTGKSVVTEECAKRYIKEMKTELGYHSSTFVEKMLIDEILMRWLQLQATENAHKNATYQSHTIETGMYHEKRLTLAQKRYLRAINTLAKVRKMVAQTQAKGAEMFVNLMNP